MSLGLVANKGILQGGEAEERIGRVKLERVHGPPREFGSHRLLSSCSNNSLHAKAELHCVVINSLEDLHNLSALHLMSINVYLASYGLR